MWWNSSPYGRQRSPSSASVSPTPFSSNLELFDDPDPDWIGGQLEQARLQRSGFYRRLHSASQRSDDDKVALQKPRRISPDDVDDTASVSSFEPHSSLRFYTSFDNGEWTRHAVPVLKVEDATKTVHNGTPKPKVSEVKTSACQAAECSLRRARQPRTTAAEVQQNRLRMRSGELMDNNSIYGRWKLSSSTETFRNTATGGSLGNISSEVHQSLDFMDAPHRQVLSPRSGRFSPWREVTSPAVLPPRSRLESPSSPKPFLPVSSCTVDGIDVTFKEKVIIPTKYKTKENNTATGSPESSKAEVPRDTSAEPEPGYSNEDLKKSVEDASANCMTGQGEVQMQKSSEQGDVVLYGRVESIRQETAQRNVKLEQPGVNSVGGSVDLDIICDLKHDQFGIVSKLMEESNFDEFSESYETTKNQELKTNAETAHVTLNGGINGTRKAEQVIEKKEITLNENRKPHVGKSLLNAKTSENAENNFEASIGRSLGDDEKHKQKSELTSKMATVLVTADNKVLSSGDKIVRFVSTFFANVNDKRNKEPCNTKNKSFNFTTTDTMGKSPSAVDGKEDTAVVDQEDDNWVVEMAVKN